MYQVTLQFETGKKSHKGKSLWTLTKEFNDLRHCNNFIAQICRTKGYFLDELWYESGFPFNEGDTYYTIEDNEVVMSCWDSISEELFHKNKLYFVTKAEAQRFASIFCNQTSTPQKNENI